MATHSSVLAWRIIGMAEPGGLPSLGSMVKHYGLLLLLSGSVMSYSVQPYGHSLPGSSVHGIFQARALEWVAISFSNACK